MHDEAQDERDIKLLMALREVMTSQSGRRVIGWILRIANARTSVTMPDPILMAAASGRRDVALAIEETLNDLVPELYDMMTWENREDERRAAANDRHND